MIDEATFGALLERHRRELHVHCYRMIGSFDEAEDLVQETLLRAWHRRDQFQGGPWFRAWLYRIATNACLDRIRRDRRRVPTLRSFAEVPWLQPYPDDLLDEVAASDDEPDAVVVARETIELGFLVALQLLPPRQRAALMVRDVLGWTAAETAALLDTSVAAANSALQRASATLAQELPQRRLDWSPPTPAMRNLGSTPTSAATRRPRSPSSATTFASRCRPTRFSTRAGTRWHPSSSGRSPSARRATGSLVPTQRQPHADGGQLPTRPGRHGVPGLQVRRAADRRRRHRRDHDIRRPLVRGVRAARDALNTPREPARARRRTSHCGRRPTAEMAGRGAATAVRDDHESRARRGGGEP